jgi:uronate dehydrogenase
MKTIAITGAAGLVGTGLRRELLQRGYALQLLDVKPIDPCYANERSVVADITDQASLTAALRGCGAVVHLAACTTDAPWPEQVKLSIEGSISLFDAAREAGVKRVVYASSHHVVGLHPRAPNGPCLGTAVQVRPDSRYAVGKAFGESIGAMYAGKYGMQVLAIRIGNVNTRPIDRRRMGNWLSWRDLGQLVALGIEHPDLVFSVVYGISDSTGRHYDNAAAHTLGYRPQDGTAAAAFEAQVLQEDPPPAAGSEAARSAAELTLGGQFSQNEFVGETARLLG